MGKLEEAARGLEKYGERFRMWSETFSTINRLLYNPYREAELQLLVKIDDKGVWVWALQFPAILIILDNSVPVEKVTRELLAEVVKSRLPAFLSAFLRDVENYAGELGKKGA